MFRTSKNFFKAILEINDASFGFYLFTVAIFFLMKRYVPELIASLKIPFENFILFLCISAILKIVERFQDIVLFFTKLQGTLIRRVIQLHGTERGALHKEALNVQKSPIGAFFIDRYGRATRAVVSFILFEKIRYGILRLAQFIVQRMLIFFQIVAWVTNQGITIFYRNFVQVVLWGVNWLMELAEFIERRWVRARSPLQLFPVVVGHLFPLSIIFCLLLIFLQGGTLYSDSLTKWIGGALGITMFLCLLWLASFRYIGQERGESFQIPGYSLRFSTGLGAGVSALAGLVIYQYTDAILFFKLVVTILGTLLIFGVSSLLLSYGEQH